MKKAIIYEKYHATDFDAYYNVVKSDKVMRFITGKGLSEAVARAKFEHFLTVNRTDPNLGYFKVIDKQTNECIGECKLVVYEKNPSVLEVGYLLKEAFWGKGYGTLICEAMLSLAASIDPTRPVIGIIDPANTASRRLLAKFGFVSFFTGEEDGLPTEKLIRRL